MSNNIKKKEWCNTERIEKPAFLVPFLLLLMCPSSYKNKITITDKLVILQSVSK